MRPSPRSAYLWVTPPTSVLTKEPPMQIGRKPYVASAKADKRGLRINGDWLHFPSFENGACPRLSSASSSTLRHTLASRALKERYMKAQVGARRSSEGATAGAGLGSRPPIPSVFFLRATESRSIGTPMPGPGHARRSRTLHAEYPPRDMPFPPRPHQRGLFLFSCSTVPLLYSLAGHRPATPTYSSPRNPYQSPPPASSPTHPAIDHHSPLPP